VGGCFLSKITVVFPVTWEKKCLGSFSQELLATENFKSAVKSLVAFSGLSFPLLDVWSNKVDSFVYFKAKVLGKGLTFF